ERFQASRQLVAACGHTRPASRGTDPGGLHRLRRRRWTAAAPGLGDRRRRAAGRSVQATGAHLHRGQDDPQARPRGVPPQRPRFRRAGRAGV
ncbi:MAG: hypothetical protein AVDCRST_MAG51-84, partial [uncultured Ramlibacter sp.]